MSKIYSIVEWNAIIFNGHPPVPTLYVHYDDDLLTLYKQRNGLISIRIMGTESGYDNAIYYATIKPSAVVGGYRPNFQKETGLWAIELYTEWNSYPPYRGIVEVLDWVNVPEEEKKKVKVVPECTAKYNSKDMYLLLLFIFIILATYYLISQMD